MAINRSKIWWYICRKCHENIKCGERVIEEVERGNNVVVVVSAMGKTTDELVTLANEIAKVPSKREMDMLLTTGEQVTISLLAMALIEQGLKLFPLQAGKQE